MLGMAALPLSAGPLCPVGLPGRFTSVLIVCSAIWEGGGERGQVGGAPSAALEDRAIGLKADQGPLVLLPVGEAGRGGWRSPCRVAHPELRGVLTSGERGARQQRERGGLGGIVGAAPDRVLRVFLCV